MDRRSVVCGASGVAGPDCGGDILPFRSMGYAQWVFVQRADLEFRSVLYALYSSFHAGTAPLPQFRPGEVRLVEAIVLLENRAAVAVRSMYFRRFPVSADGARDAAAAEREMSLWGSVSPLGSETGLQSATGRFARRQLEAEFAWTPTAPESRSIAEAVNRRARRHILGRAPVRLVD
jgi:hypothetical protein